MVAEVSVQGGEVRVHKVVCALDCGTVIHPDMVVQQMEGGIVFGLTSLLKGEITFDQGRVTQGNFDDYPLLRMDEMPEVEVHLVPSRRAPLGVGEMGVPPVVPAVLNAILRIHRAFDLSQIEGAVVFFGLRAGRSKRPVGDLCNICCIH
jgi:isoquinoline 1-oxidoreductase beta subunit